MFELKEITGGTLFMSDGTKLMNISSEELTYEPNVIYEREESWSHNFNGEFTLEINNAEINSAIGIDKSKFPAAYDLEYIHFVQARTHKKKRINKKWLKRYGVIGIPFKAKGWKLTNYADGSFEFVKE